MVESNQGAVRTYAGRSDARERSIDGGFDRLGTPRVVEGRCDAVCRLPRIHAGDALAVLVGRVITFRNPGGRGKIPGRETPDRLDYTRIGGERIECAGCV